MPRGAREAARLRVRLSDPVRRLRRPQLSAVLAVAVGWVGCAHAPPKALRGGPSLLDDLRPKAADAVAKPAVRADEPVLPPSTSPPRLEGQGVMALLRLASEQLAAGRIADASDSIDRAEADLAATGQSHPDIPLLRGLCALRAPDPEAGIRMLRQELADGAHPGSAALHLADHLARAERLDEALAVLDAGLARESGRLELDLARAQVLMDLGEYRLAASRLRELAKLQESPRVLWMAAVAERALGDKEAALVHLRTLRTEYSDHPWVQQWRPEIDHQERSLQITDPAATDYSERELLAILRSSENVVMRVRALRTLAVTSAPSLDTALRIGQSDPQHLVRLEALRQGFVMVANRTDWLRVGLEDRSAVVRGVAARLAVGLPRADAITLLSKFLDGESDGYVVRQMHTSLVELTGERADPIPAGALQSDQVERIRTYWRHRWDRQSW